VAPRFLSSTLGKLKKKSYERTSRDHLELEMLPVSEQSLLSEQLSALGLQRNALCEWIR
jgi:hypothetical protein